MLLDVWAERAVGHFQHASVSAVGNGGAAEIPRPGALGSTAAVRRHSFERQYISGSWKAEIIPGTYTPPVPRNLLIF